jgi:hypothetical protein
MENMEAVAVAAKEAVEVEVGLACPLQHNSLAPVESTPSHLD